MSKFNWIENIKIEVRDIEGKLVDTTEFHNQIMDGGLNWLADSLRISTQDNEIKYFAWGASSGALSTSQTALSTERGRKLLTSQSSSNVGKCFSVCYISPSEATTSIEEFGWFAGSSAEASAGTGRMISRVLYSRVKTSLESLTVTRTDSFTT